jgi:hypothetical protein
VRVLLSGFHQLKTSLCGFQLDSQTKPAIKYDNSLFPLHVSSSTSIPSFSLLSKIRDGVNVYVIQILMINSGLLRNKT